MATPVIDSLTFYRRLTSLVRSWSDPDSGFGGSGSLLVLLGDREEEVRFSRTLSMHTWLMAWEMPGIAILITSGRGVVADAIAAAGSTDSFISSKAGEAEGGGGPAVVVVAAGKKARMFEDLSKAKRPEGTLAWPLRVVKRSKENQDADGLAALAAAVRGSDSGGAARKVGVLAKEKQAGDFAAAVGRTVDGVDGVERVDISVGIASLLAVKAPEELTLVRKASTLAQAVLRRHFVPEMEAIVDRGKRVTHSRLADGIDDAIEDPGRVKVNLNQTYVTSAFHPIVQSGGTYDLRTSAFSDDKPLHPGTIIVRFASRYREYCGGIARTFMIDPTPEQEENFKALLRAQTAAIDALRPGTPLNKVHATVVDMVRELRGEEVAQKLTRTFGFATGIEYRDSAHVISAKNQRTVRAGMVFHVAVGLEGLEISPPKDGDAERGSKYALMLGDTVVVTAEDAGANEIVTGDLRKTEDTTYHLADDGDGGAGGGGDGDSAAEIKGKAILAEKLRGEKNAEELRKEHQDELAARRREEALRRYKGTSAAGSSESTGDKQRLREVKAYGAVTDFDNRIRMDRITVDARRDAVLFPVNTYLTPFHVSTIKRVTKLDEGGYTYLRFLFATPDQGPRSANNQVMGDPESNAYVKELSFRSKDTAEMVRIQKAVNDLRKKFNAAQSERKEKAKIVAQEDLQVLRGSNPKLRNVYIRPYPGRRAQGTLEAHANGLRFTPAKGGAAVDVIFRNIKHAFFQPAENEAIVLIHFHLHNPVMIGKRSSKDVQVYTEVMEASYALDKSSKNKGYDYDEIEEEQREREVRQRLNENFQGFVKKLEDAIARNGIDIEFDIPYRELGFHGVPHKAMSFILPSVHCLVELTESPFFIITLDEVEIAHLERVQHGLANFDMVFVLKDFSQAPIHVNTIDMKSLEAVKKWLDSSDIKYYEGRANLHWNKIMATIREDPAGFFEDGGWDFLDMDKVDSDEEEESDDDESDFAPSSDELEEESSSDEYSVDASDDYDGGSYGSEDMSEEALSWDELDRQAKRDDRDKERRGGFGDDNEREGGGHHKKRARHR